MKNLFVISILLVMSANVSAEGGDVLSWLSEKNIEIRKSFDGTVKDAAAPASFNYFNADDGDDYYAIDFALRAGEFGGWGSGNWQGRFYPFVEHHKKTQDVSEMDKTTLAIGSEVERSLRSCDIQGVSTSFCTSLLIDAKYRVTRDSHNDKTVRSASLLIAPTSIKHGWPGYDFTTAKNNSYFYWLPSIGFETYESLPIEKKIDGEAVVVAPKVDENFMVARLNLMFRPFADSLEGRLAITADYSHHYLHGSSDFVDDRSDNVSISLDYFLDAKKRIAIGYKYEKGESPSRNFLDQEFSSVGLSLKITP